MIRVRDVFRLHFGKAREAVALAREGREIMERAGNPAGRILTDVTGEYYTLVFESEYESLADYEERLREGLETPDWREWYARFTPLVREGRREVYRIVE